VEEYLYPAMEDFRLDITIDSGTAARAMKIDLPPFTLVGATTRTGLLTSPLRDRFQIQERLDYYAPADLEAILARSSGILGVQLAEDGAREIATRSRGTPRIANRLLRRIRDFAEVAGVRRVGREVASRALERLEVDRSGLDPMDRKILLTILEKFGGGPVGLDTIAASVGEQRETVEDVYEPFLMQEGFLHRTPRGRVATARCWRYFDKPPPADVQGALF
jgi:Holliday junction DNA helicase RuvB